MGHSRCNWSGGHRVLYRGRDDREIEARRLQGRSATRLNSKKHRMIDRSIQTHLSTVGWLVGRFRVGSRRGAPRDQTVVEIRREVIEDIESSHVHIPCRHRSVAM